MIDVWGPDRSGDLAALVGEAMPEEALSHDELLACCWDDPGVVLGHGDDAAVAAVVRSFGEMRTGFLKLLVVHPGQRRLGVGRALVRAAEEWSFDQGATAVRIAGSVPTYLWPGVDLRATAMLCLAEACGYHPDGAELNMSCPTTFRHPPPEGTAVRRAVTDDDAAALLDWTATSWPQWRPELERAIEQGGAFGSFDTGGVTGFACHSVHRAAWIGPMATDRERHKPGTGSALLGALCTDLMVAGYHDGEIAWVGPISFYAKASGASVSRVFRTYIRTRRSG